MPPTYKPRVVDAELLERLRSNGATVIEGPKACGKTQTARQVARSEVLLDNDANAARAAKTSPALVLDGEVPRLLDEWQIVPTLWNAVRREVDNRSKSGQFILTGSATPDDDINRHTGAGRFSFLRMRPMSLFESGVSSGDVSLDALLSGETEQAADPGLKIPDLAEWITRGGWPNRQSADPQAAARAAKDYLKQVVTTDVPTLAAVRSPDTLNRLLTALARSTSQDRSIAKLANELREGGSGPDRETVSRYIEALTRLMIVEPQPSWGDHLRTKAAVTHRERWHFTCPSLAVAALGGSADKVLEDMNTFGFLFESLVVRDLRVYSQIHDGAVKGFRNNAGVEVDAIVELSDGRWGAFEVKLGSDPNMLDTAARKLVDFAANVDTRRIQEPSTLVIITGSGYSYRRDDGVHIVSIATLGP